MHYNYKSDEKIMNNILPTDPNKKIKLIIYYNKFKTPLPQMGCCKEPTSSSVIAQMLNVYISCEIS